MNEVVSIFLFSLIKVHRSSRIVRLPVYERKATKIALVGLILIIWYTRIYRTRKSLYKKKVSETRIKPKITFWMSKIWIRKYFRKDFRLMMLEVLPTAMMSNHKFSSFRIFKWNNKITTKKREMSPFMVMILPLLPIQLAIISVFQILSMKTSLKTNNGW